ncbi:unnamed protein product [Lampetra fluviatilis]
MKRAANRPPPGPPTTEGGGPRRPPPRRRPPLHPHPTASESDADPARRTVRWAAAELGLGPSLGATRPALAALEGGRGGAPAAALRFLVRRAGGAGGAGGAGAARGNVELQARLRGGETGGTSRIWSDEFGFSRGRRCQRSAPVPAEDHTQR